MSFVLTDLDGNELRVSTNSIFNSVTVGQYSLKLEQLLLIAKYVLTNTDLVGDKDPRLEFVRAVRSMKKAKGYKKGAKRLDFVRPEDVV